MRLPYNYHVDRNEDQVHWSTKKGVKASPMTIVPAQSGRSQMFDGFACGNCWTTSVAHLLAATKCPLRQQILRTNLALKYNPFHTSFLSRSFTFVWLCRGIELQQLGCYRVKMNLFRIIGTQDNSRQIAQQTNLNSRFGTRCLHLYTATKNEVFECMGPWNYQNATEQLLLTLMAVS